jgi:Mg2+ and Co2+ transporter CorA
MDSVVDAFFPIMDFIEGESNEVDSFLSDPLAHHSPANVGSKAAPSGVGVVAGRKVFDENVVSIVMDELSKDEKERLSSDVASLSSIKRATVQRRSPTSVLRILPFLPLSASILRLLPRSFVKETTRTFKSTMIVDHDGVELCTLSEERPIDATLVPDYLKEGVFSDTRFDRSIMLKRITDMRKLVTGLNRLLGTKSDVVRGLRKRTMEENLGLFQNDAKHDIAVYIGDLYGAHPPSLPHLLLSLTPPSLQTISSRCNSHSFSTTPSFLTTTPPTLAFFDSPSPAPSAVPTWPLSSFTSSV